MISPGVVETEMTKTFLSFMPNSIYNLPEKEITKDDSLRKEEFLLNFIPKNKRNADKCYRFSYKG